MSFYYGSSNPRFCVWDYVVLFLLLSCSVAVGFYYSYKSRKGSSSSEFMLGGSSIGSFPLVMSIVASGISGITVMTDCTETFYHGTQLQIGYFGFLIMAVCINRFVVPVYWNLNITTVYQYLEMRFNTKISIVCSATNLIHSILYLGCAVYTPALALNQLTGASIWTSVLLLVGVCTLYTLLGGLKAVVWSDTLQATVLGTTVLVVFIYGTVSVGGVDTVWQRSQQTGRIEYFNLSPDFTVRNTLWGTTIYIFTSWFFNFCGSQAMVQRYLRASSMKAAKRVVLIGASMDLIISVFAFFNGLVIYANYYQCDPLQNGDVTKADQILPFYILNKLGKYPGLAGLLMAGVYSGALSVTSANLNANSVVLVEDYVKKIWKSMSESSVILASRIAILVCAFLSILIVFVIDRSSQVLQINNTLSGIMCGPSLGVFILGLTLPSSNWVGALAGLLVSFVFMFWISFNAVFFPPAIPSLPFGNCSLDSEYSFIFTNTTSVSSNWQGVDFLYNISYTWYPSMGTLISVVVGLVVSFATKNCIENKRNHKLYFEQVNWIMEHCGCAKENIKTQDQ